MTGHHHPLGSICGYIMGSLVMLIPKETEYVCSCSFNATAGSRRNMVEGPLTSSLNPCQPYLLP